MKKAAIIGGTGYGAVELLRILQHHSQIEIKHIISHSQHGERISSFYPHLTGLVEAPMEKLDIDRLKEEADIIFFATPAGIAKEIIPQFVDSEVQCIDLSGDLRLDSPLEYEEWYKKEAAPESLLNEAVYGLSEIYPEQISNARIISNPGCFPTSALLGLIPAVEQKLIASGPIVIDGKTGVSGAGRTPTAMTHYSETNENVSPYKIGIHQHIPEIEQYLGSSANSPMKVCFTTHLVPMTRGLICTMYGQLDKALGNRDAIEIYKEYYTDHPFVRIREEGDFPSTKQVHGSNFCDIGIHVDQRTNQIVIASAIDNLVKGAAGQAVQNMNLMNGWEEELGLINIPIYP